MGTFARNVLMACVAAITLLLAGCSGGAPHPAPPQPTQSTSVQPSGRTVTTIVPATPDDVKLMTKYSIVVGASTLVCGTGKDLPQLDLPLNGEVGGFAGDPISVHTADGVTRIEWDTLKARSIIVNGKLWSPIDNLYSPLTTQLDEKDWSGKITSIKACNWQM